MIKKRLLPFLLLLLTTGLSAQFNQFNFCYAQPPYTSAATITSTSVTIPYTLSVTNYAAPSTGSGGKITGRVYLVGGSNSYYVGEFHHSYTYGSSGYGVTAPGYPTAGTPFPEAAFAGTYTPLVTSSSAVIPFSTTCVPNGTYTVTLEVSSLSISEEVPHGAIVKFLVNGSTSNPTAIITSSSWDVYVGLLGSANLGTVTISGSSSTYGATVATTLGTCSSYGSFQVTGTSGASPFTFSYRKVISASNLGTVTTQTSSTASFTASSISPGNYDLLLTDANGCQWFKRVTMGASPSPTVTISPGDQTVSVGTCLGMTGSVSPSGSYSYSWTHWNASTSTHSVGTTSTICATIPLPGGSGRYRPNYYQLQVSNAYCSGTSAVRTITADSYYMNVSGNGCCAASGRLAAGNDSAAVVYSLYPSPASNSVTVSFPGLDRKDVTLEIMDASGKLVRSQAVADGAQRVELDVTSLPSGLYLVRMFSAGEQLMSESFIRE